LGHTGRCGRTLLEATASPRSCGPEYYMIIITNIWLTLRHVFPCTQLPNSHLTTLNPIESALLDTFRVLTDISRNRVPVASLQSALPGTASPLPQNPHLRKTGRARTCSFTPFPFSFFACYLARRWSLAAGQAYLAPAATTHRRRQCSSRPTGDRQGCP
jgi:hypothetical protein